MEDVDAHAVDEEVEEVEEVDTARMSNEIAPAKKCHRFSTGDWTVDPMPPSVIKPRILLDCIRALMHPDTTVAEVDVFEFIGEKEKTLLAHLARWQPEARASPAHKPMGSPPPPPLVPC